MYSWYELLTEKVVTDLIGVVLIVVGDIDEDDVHYRSSRSKRGNKVEETIGEDRRGIRILYFFRDCIIKQKSQNRYYNTHHTDFEIYNQVVMLLWSIDLTSPQDHFAIFTIMIYRIMIHWDTFLFVSSFICSSLSTVLILLVDEELVLHLLVYTQYLHPYQGEM